MSDRQTDRQTHTHRAFPTESYMLLVLEGFAMLCEKRTMAFMSMTFPNSPSPKSLMKMSFDLG